MQHTSQFQEQRTLLRMKHLSMFQHMCDEGRDRSAVMMAGLIIAGIPDGNSREELRHLRETLTKEKIEALPKGATPADIVRATVEACKEVVLKSTDVV